VPTDGRIYIYLCKEAGNLRLKWTNTHSTYLDNSMKIFHLLTYANRARTGAAKHVSMCRKHSWATCTSELTA
jgi:hypothetical protein